MEFGCGYGTFTFPAARRVSGTVHTFDIEPELVALVQCRSWAEEAGFVFLRDQDLSECGPYHYGMLLVRPGAKKAGALQGGS